MNPKSTQSFWNNVWSQPDHLLREIVPDDKRIRNYGYSEMIAFFEHVFSTHPEGARIVEIGCGGSRWLPYFAKYRRYQVSGLDYSPEGVASSRKLLERTGVTGTILEGDMFDPPVGSLGAADIAISFGLVEHFDDTSAAITATAKFVRPDGTVFTLIPNFAGIAGIAMRIINKDVYDTHKILDREGLIAATKLAGLSDVSGGYLLANHFGVCNNLVGLRPNSFQMLKARALVRLLSLFTLAVWIADKYIVRLPCTRALSPYVWTVARTPKC